MSKQEAREPGKTEALAESFSGARGVEGSEPLASVPEETWENMYKALYSYYFGHMDFLTLLDKWEEMLHIKSPIANPLDLPKPKASK